MPRVIETGHVPIFVWAGDPPDGAIRQLRAIAGLPFVVGRVAAMPDLHVAEGVSVGTVFATERHLVPAALGGDLGCGMSAVSFRFPAASLSRDDLREILGSLGRAFGPKGKKDSPGEAAQALLAEPLSTRALDHDRERFARSQLGTVGGGNHFVELDRDMEGDLWLLVHSGSRGIGAAIGAHHGKAARAAAGPGAEPGWLEVESDAGRAFVADLGWALRYARANRDRLVELASGVLAERLEVAADPLSRVDVPHNFAALETHGGRQVWVHRKGASAAPAGARVLIPGSMGTASYLAEGLGEPSSFASCSHGAGRVMSRREARERVGVGALEHSMRRVVFEERLSRALAEEAPAAYRDIAEVLAEQEDLVRPAMRLEPVAVFKGG